MPVLEVEIVGEVGSVERRDLAARIADDVAAILDARPASVWVRVRYTPLRDYAENVAPGEPPPETPLLPVFVTIILRAWPEREAMKRQARALALAVGAASGRPAENVHIFYEPPGGGRVAFGGTLVE